MMSAFVMVRRSGILLSLTHLANAEIRAKSNELAPALTGNDWQTRLQTLVRGLHLGVCQRAVRSAISEAPEHALLPRRDPAGLAIVLEHLDRDAQRIADLSEDRAQLARRSIGGHEEREIADHRG